MKTIKDLPEHSRPREKLREKGASALTDVEAIRQPMTVKDKSFPYGEKESL